MAIDEINNDALTATEETVPDGTVTVNFNTMKASSMELGHIGEHNAVTLEISWTNEDERVAAYRVAFQTGGKSILSDSYSSMPIEVALWQQLTMNPRCSIQVIAYDANGDYIGKSAKFSGFYFAPSVSGRDAQTETEANDIASELSRVEATVSAMSDEVDANTAARHTHSNKTVLDKFGEEDGNPTYDGNPIGGGGAVDDVRDSSGSSLVVNKIATVPDEVVELLKQDGTLAYSIDDIFSHMAKKVMYLRGNLVVAKKTTATSPIHYQIYFVRQNNYSPYNYQLCYNEYLYDGSTVSSNQVAGRWSDQNYEYSEKTKLANIEASAQVNKIEKIKDSNGTELTITNKAVTLPAIPAAQIQSDWEQSDNTALDYIKNKPSIPSAQIQADWNEADNTKADYIKNKPTIPDVSGKEDTSNKLLSVSGGGAGITSSATDTQYPSAKAVYDALPNIPDGTNSGDILVWNGSAWVSKPLWQANYQPVDYIEVSGTQHINLGTFTSDRIVADFQYTSAPTAGNMFLSSGTSSSGLWLGGNANYFRYGVSGSSYNAPAIDTERHIMDISTTAQYFDGSLIASHTGTVGSKYYRVFANGDDGTLKVQHGRLYNAKLYYQGEIIVDLVPCYHILTKTIGLYDVVNNQFYTNAGTGNFTCYPAPPTT